MTANLRVALSSALLGALAALTISACATASPPTPVASPAPLPVAVAPVPAAAPPIVPTPTTTTTTSAKPTTTITTTPKRKVKTAAECKRIGSESNAPLSDLNPYLRSIGCGGWLDAAEAAAEASAEAEEDAADDGYVSDGLESACSSGQATIEQCFGPGSDGNDNGVADVNE